MPRVIEYSLFLHTGHIFFIFHQSNFLHRTNIKHGLIEHLPHNVLLPLPNESHEPRNQFRGMQRVLEWISAL
jgi:hypothetical protein